jgi:hypothetical protein
MTLRLLVGRELEMADLELKLVEIFNSLLEMFLTFWWAVRDQANTSQGALVAVVVVS